ncbi:hypothetical protein B2J93_8312 [Marssonina coronariae]|uniref:Uncharacterized protein n=1 Tax=Diplocarpon coronariae TaxID=2795749 RepID=A0A218ZAL7_9HELO|nr:hypothetical protein B2J93_8312 [Marssonina coronariae]
MQKEKAKGIFNPSPLYVYYWLTILKCNQAKDRPCSNCSRRYPPVTCTYESSSSPPTSSDRSIDFRDVNKMQRSRINENEASGPAYSEVFAASPYDLPATSWSNAYHNSTEYYAPATTRADYQQCQADGYLANARYVTTTSGNYTTAETNYEDQTSWKTTAESTHYGYYPDTEQQRADWLSINGDPAAFVGMASGNYYAHEPDLDDQASHRRGSGLT